MMSLLLRFDLFTIPSRFLYPALKFLPLDIFIAISVLAIFKMYNRVWTYASLDEVMSALKASIVIELIYLLYHKLLNVGMPRSYYFFDITFLFLLIALSRLSVRVFKGIIARRQKSALKRNIMIIGAGSAGSLLIKEIRNGMKSYDVVCIIDDNDDKVGKYIHNIPIVGARDDILKNIAKYDVDEVIIAMPSASVDTIRDIITICNQTSVKLKILPAIAKSLTSSLTQKVREVNYEDLLGRDAVDIKNKELKKFVDGKTVMVTGGGGTIGSELCRQITANNPKRLIVVDIYENTAYELQMELKRKHPDIDVTVLIASIRDMNRMDSIFNKYKPEIVYHAAAHKHVPLMEYSPNEAVKNNCKGTLNLVKLADKYKVERFVLISTDKAVRPTNVMGATKRICEMIIQSYNSKSETEFVAVRFGNVLGSNGSVIPLFLKQIEEGGPVTVTHKEVTRFFMTVREAVSLVIQAGLLAKGGEIFVLDMGKPVKIYDLAVNLIKLKGYIPGEEIKIDVVGLRPGEKMYEEILMEEEGLTGTKNHMIYIAKPIDIEINEFLTDLNELINIAYENNDEIIRNEIKKLCPTYKEVKND
ncbi:nucleoside-diphosphate sugar epimerase/dehydratase [uncultured Anaerofustis sp.]|uniref:polysaccharide biosynthesis protein n=1 Tax=uncultured Anaerofustis sp. TaxID=904996 RepID=UPI0025FCEC54|nr:nucleoside-diphosphate sugar epimerase/dehydratase [uncultured Anaerofustis sp.]